MGLNVLFLTSTLPRFADDQQAPFVLEQSLAWQAARPDDKIVILAPHDQQAERREKHGSVEIRRFQYFLPARLQGLAYPAILPNLKRNPLLASQIMPLLWAEYAAARRVVHEEKIDLVYAHWVMPQGVVARWLKRRTGVPYILQNHSSDLSVFHKAGSAGRAAARAIIRDSERLFCVNSRQKDEALDFFAPASRAEMSGKITVLPMGVGMDVSDIAPAGAEGHRHRYTLSAISRLSRKKGLHHFIEAAERLAERGVTVPIGIAGDGEERESLRAMARKADISFEGFLSGAGKIAFFKASRFMVFPSVSAGSDVEGLPVALLEALCCGKCVIASRDTNITTLTEWPQIRDAVVLLRDPRDIEEFVRGIEQLLDLDEASLSSRSSGLREVMARYLWANLIEEYLAAIGPDQIARQGLSRERKSATSSSY